MPDSLDVVSMSTTLYVYIHMYDDNILRIRRPQSYYLAIKFIPPFSILVNNMWRGEALHNSTLLVSSRVNNHCKFLWHTKASQMRSPLLSVLTSWPCQANYSTWMIPIKKKATGNFDLLCLCTSDQTKNRPHFFVSNTSYISVRSGRRTNGPVSR